MYIAKEDMHGWVRSHLLLILEIFACAAKGVGASVFGAVFQGFYFVPMDLMIVK